MNVKYATGNTLNVCEMTKFADKMLFNLNAYYSNINWRHLNLIIYSYRHTYLILNVYTSELNGI